MSKKVPASWPLLYSSLVPLLFLLPLLVPCKTMCALLLQVQRVAAAPLHAHLHHHRSCFSHLYLIPHRRCCSQRGPVFLVPCSVPWLCSLVTANPGNLIQGSGIKPSYKLACLVL